METGRVPESGDGMSDSRARAEEIAKGIISFSLYKRSPGSPDIDDSFLDDVEDEITKALEARYAEGFGAGVEAAAKVAEQWMIDSVSGNPKKWPAYSPVYPIRSLCPPKEPARLGPTCKEEKPC